MFLALVIVVVVRCGDGDSCGGDVVAPAWHLAVAVAVCCCWSQLLLLVVVLVVVVVVGVSRSLFSSGYCFFSICIVIVFVLVVVLIPGLALVLPVAFLSFFVYYSSLFSVQNACRQV